MKRASRCKIVISAICYTRTSPDRHASLHSQLLRLLLTASQSWLRAITHDLREYLTHDPRDP